MVSFTHLWEDNNIRRQMLPNILALSAVLIKPYYIHQTSLDGSRLSHVIIRLRIFISPNAIHPVYLSTSAALSVAQGCDGLLVGKFRL